VLETRGKVEKQYKDPGKMVVDCLQLHDSG